MSPSTKKKCLVHDTTKLRCPIMVHTFRVHEQSAHSNSFLIIQKLFKHFSISSIWYIIHVFVIWKVCKLRVYVHYHPTLCQIKYAHYHVISCLIYRLYYVRFVSKYLHIVYMKLGTYSYMTLWEISISKNQFTRNLRKIYRLASEKFEHFMSHLTKLLGLQGTAARS